MAGFFSSFGVNEAISSGLNFLGLRKSSCIGATTTKIYASILSVYIRGGNDKIVWENTGSAITLAFPPAFCKAIHACSDINIPIHVHVEMLKAYTRLHSNKFIRHDRMLKSSLSRTCALFIYAHKLAWFQGQFVDVLRGVIIHHLNNLAGVGLLLDLGGCCGW